MIFLLINSLKKKLESLRILVHWTFLHVPFLNHSIRCGGMARLSPLLKLKLSEKLQQGWSINNLARELSLAKSTIYYYYRKINGKKYQEPTFISSNSELEGIFAGDGSQHYNRKKGSYQVNVHFGIKNKRYAEYVKQLFESFFGKPFRLNLDGDNKLRLRIESRRIFRYFEQYLSYNSRVKHCTVQLKPDCSAQFKIGFLRGFFDTDGCFYQDPGCRRIKLFYTTTSEVLALQIRALISDLNIQSSLYIRTPAYEKPVYIVNILKEGRNRFIKVVKPLKAQRAGNSAR